jgi:hypothetical protein
MAWQSGAIERLRGFPSPDVLLRMLLLHVARGYSLRETVVRAKLANWTDISWRELPPPNYRVEAEPIRRLCRPDQSTQAHFSALTVDRARHFSPNRNVMPTVKPIGYPGVPCTRNLESDVGVTLDSR